MRAGCGRERAGEGNVSPLVCLCAQLGTHCRCTTEHGSPPVNPCSKNVSVTETQLIVQYIDVPCPLPVHPGPVHVSVPANATPAPPGDIHGNQYAREDPAQRGSHAQSRGVSVREQCSTYHPFCGGETPAYTVC